MSEVLIHCAKYGYLEKVHDVLQAGADVNGQPGKEKATALYYAACFGHLDICNLLLNYGADPNIPVRWGSTPLHAACDRGHQEILKLLLIRNLKVNHQNDSGDTALHIAAYRGNLRIVQALVRSGIELRIQNKKGKTAQEEAEGKNYRNIAKYLAEASLKAPFRLRPKTSKIQHSNTSPEFTEEILSQVLHQQHFERHKSESGTFDKQSLPMESDFSSGSSYKLTSNSGYDSFPETYRSDTYVRPNSVFGENYNFASLPEKSSESVYGIQSGSPRTIGLKKTTKKPVYGYQAEPDEILEQKLGDSHQRGDLAIEKENVFLNERVNGAHAPNISKKLIHKGMQPLPVNTSSLETLQAKNEDLQRQIQILLPFQAKNTLLEQELWTVRQDREHLRQQLELISSQRDDAQEALCQIRSKQTVKEARLAKKEYINLANNDTGPNKISCVDLEESDYVLCLDEIESSSDDERSIRKSCAPPQNIQTSIVPDVSSSMASHDCVIFDNSVRDKVTERTEIPQNIGTSKTEISNDQEYNLLTKMRKFEISKSAMDGYQKLLKSYSSLPMDSLEKLVEPLCRQLNSLVEFPARVMLDDRGKEWTLGKDYVLVDSKLLNHKPSSSYSLVFRIIRGGLRYILKMILKSSSTYDIPLQLSEHPNIMQISHYYNGATQSFKQYFVHAGMEIATKAMFVVLPLYPLTLKILFAQLRASNPRPPFDVGEQLILLMLYQLLSAVNHLLLHGIVHRDIRPENVYLDDKLRLFLGDFSCARRLFTLEGQDVMFVSSDQIVAGNSDAWAPELVTLHNEGPQSLPQQMSLTDVYSHTDIYAVGRLFYGLLQPPQQNFSQLFMKMPDQIPQLPTCYSTGLRSIVMQLIHRNPNSRLRPREAMTRVGLLLFGPSTSKVHNEKECMIWRQAEMMEIISTGKSVFTATKCKESSSIISLSGCTELLQQEMKIRFLSCTSATEIWQACSWLKRLHADS